MVMLKNIDSDGPPKYNKLSTIIKSSEQVHAGEQYYPFINQQLVNLGDVYVLMINCSPSTTACYLDGKDFYVRTNPATDRLEGPKLVEYVRNHFNN